MRELFEDYKSEILFGAILATCVGLSMWLSHYFTEDYFDYVVTPCFNTSVTVVALMSAILMFRHSDGLRIRKAWGACMLSWGILELALMSIAYDFDIPVYDVDAKSLAAFELVVGNFLGWLLLIYPTEMLRPGWLNVKRAAMQFGPMFALVAIDYLVPINLGWLVSLYPVFLGILLLRHIHVYRVWCEQNFSTMDEIDVQWIIRYIIMLALAGITFMYICTSENHMRVFTQQWLILFIFVYGTDEILYRRDPWENLMVHSEDLSENEDSVVSNNTDNTISDSEGNLVYTEGNSTSDTTDYAAYRETLENWMMTEKPYLKPEFRLLDLRAVLPLNRTYLSQLINSEYDCNFYQYVTRYRIEEAKRLMRECPEMKIQDISSQSGFSSPTVFARIFTRETGYTPREWGRKIDNT